MFGTHAGDPSSDRRRAPVFDPVGVWLVLPEGWRCPFNSGPANTLDVSASGVPVNIHVATAARRISAELHGQATVG
jgi:hypothetical protein